MRTLRICCLAVFLLSGAAGSGFAADSARVRYDAALSRERAIRAGDPTLRQLRRAIAAYEAIVRRYPRSPYSDNALWQAAGLAIEAFGRFHEERDRTTGIRLLRALGDSYPSSSLVSRLGDRIAELQASATPSGDGAREERATVGAAPPEPADLVAHSNEGVVPTMFALTPPPAAPAAASEEQIPQKTASRLIRDVQRIRMPDVVRIVLEMDGEVTYRDERLANPDRVFFDLSDTAPTTKLRDVSWTYTDDVVRAIRFGRHPNNVTRVVLDLQGVSSYSVSALQNPYRLVVDCARVVRGPSPVTTSFSEPPVERRPVRETPLAPGLLLDPIPIEPVTVPPEFALPDPPRNPPGPTVSGTTTVPVRPEEPALPAPRPASPPAASAPVATSTKPRPIVPALPTTNSTGRFSLARQLGLGISRVVIDPGHGGHDPGAQAVRLTEAELVLDVSLRLEKLLAKEPAFEVVMTRRTDVFVTLEERTAIANESGADLFLSIHANASRDPKAGGVETYFLNFASNPAAAAVAARENSVSGANMGKLPDIVKAIALNNKVDESRDLAATVQGAMVKRLRGQHKGLRNLGVKQAPFVVLIGAGMPSVLAEVSFVTNRDEGRLLRTNQYRQRIAEALFEAILGYQRSLKNVGTVAQQQE